MEKFFNKYPKLNKELKFKDNNGNPISIGPSGNLWQLALGYEGLIDHRIKRMKAGRKTPKFKIEE